MYYRNVLTKIKDNEVYVYLEKEYKFVNPYVKPWINDTISMIEDESFINVLKTKKMIKEHGQSCRIITRDNIQKIHLQLTKACMCKCEHCYVGEESKSFIQYEDAQTILNYAMEEGATSVDYSGGEPTLHPDFKSIVSYGKEQGLRQMLFTNGYVNENLFSEIEKSIDVIQISIDGPEEYHNRFRGNNHVYHKALNFLEYFRDVNVKKIVSMSLTSKNVDYIPFVYRLAESNNAELRLSPPVPVGRFSGKQNQYYIKLIDQAKRVCKQAGIAPQEFIPSTPKCDAIKKTIYIDSDLEVYPCPLLCGDAYKLGNLAQDSLGTILFADNAQKLKKRIDEVSKTRSKCIFFCPAYFVNMDCNNNFFGDGCI